MNYKQLNELRRDMVEKLGDIDCSRPEVFQLVKIIQQLIVYIDECVKRSAPVRFSG
jgi:hypothetical protein